MKLGVVARTAFVFVWLVGCGSSTHSGGGTTIGPSGGTVTSDDRALVITFPAGAVTSNVAVTIERLSAPPAGAIGGRVYELEPSGRIFAKAVTLSFEYATKDLGGTAPQSLRVATFSAGAWTAVETVLDEATRHVSAQVTHFSAWAVVPAAETSDGSDAATDASDDAGAASDAGPTQNADAGDADATWGDGDGAAGGGDALVVVRCPDGSWSGDFTGDGFTDCLVPSGTDLELFEGAPSGVATTSVTTKNVLPFDVVNEPIVSAVVADLDADGKADLTIVGRNTDQSAAASGYVVAAYWLREQTGGTFFNHNAWGSGNPYDRLYVGGQIAAQSRGATPLALGDFNGDGKPDVFFPFFVPTSSNTLHWIVLSYDAGVSYLAENDTASGFILGLAGGIRSTPIAVGDVDGDHKLDAIVVLDIKSASQLGPGGAVVLALGNGDGSFKSTTIDASTFAPGSMVPGTSGATAVAARDLNGDGKLDLVVELPGGPTSFYGDGAAHFSTTLP